MSLVRKPAPEFNVEAVMPDGGSQNLSLSSFKGRKYVVLFFYPFDFTFVCPTEILAFSNHIEEFKKRAVEVLGCSIDSAHVHRAWRSTKIEDGGIGQISYPLLADVNKDVARAYGVLLEGGPSLAWSAVREQVIDRVVAYVAPLLIGGASAPTALDGSGFAPITSALRLGRLDVSPMDDDLKVVADVHGHR